MKRLSAEEQRLFPLSLGSLFPLGRKQAADSQGCIDDARDSEQLVARCRAGQSGPTAIAEHLEGYSRANRKIKNAVDEERSTAARAIKQNGDTRPSDLSSV